MARARLCCGWGLSAKPAHGSPTPTSHCGQAGERAVALAAVACGQCTLSIRTWPPTPGLCDREGGGQGSLPCLIFAFLVPTRHLPWVVSWLPGEMTEWPFTSSWPSNSEGLQKGLQYWPKFRGHVGCWGTSGTHDHCREDHAVVEGRHNVIIQQLYWCREGCRGPDSHLFGIVKGKCVWCDLKALGERWVWNENVPTATRLKMGDPRDASVQSGSVDAQASAHGESRSPEACVKPHFMPSCLWSSFRERPSY